MDLTTAGLITGAVGFIAGSLLTTLIFLIVTGTKKAKVKKIDRKRHEIIGSIGKKCAEIDHAYSEYRIGKIAFESLGAMILEKIEDVSSELNGNSDILDAFYIKNIERFLQDQKAFLMGDISGSESQERGAVRPSPGTNIVEQTEAAIEKDSSIQEISADVPVLQEEAFSVEPADEAEEFHIEEEPAFEAKEEAVFEPAIKEQAPIQNNEPDSAFSESSPKVDMGVDEDFDLNATTILSVDQIQGAIKEEELSNAGVSPFEQPKMEQTPKVTPTPASFEPPAPAAISEPAPSFDNSKFEGESLLNTAKNENPVPVAPLTPPEPKEPLTEQPFVDMDATQVFDQSMFHADAQAQQVQQPPQKQASQFEQPIPEPPKAPAQPQMPQQPAFQEAPFQPQQSLSAFDVEATQEFHVSDIMQHAQQPAAPQGGAGGSEEVFEINMPQNQQQPQPQQPQQPQKPKGGEKGNGMVSGDDVADQMDNFFGFD